MRGTENPKIHIQNIFIFPKLYFILQYIFSDSTAPIQILKYTVYPCKTANIKKKW